MRTNVTEGTDGGNGETKRNKGQQRKIKETVKRGNNEKIERT